MKKRLMPELPEEVEEVFAELAREEEKIIKKAKEEGRWAPGLDSNKVLFIEANAKARKKLELAKEYQND